MKISFVVAILFSLCCCSVCTLILPPEDDEQAPEAVALQIQGPTTANELLKQLDQEDRWQFHAPGKLSTQEAAKAAAVLRKRYPFESIRDRLTEKDQLAHPKDSSGKKAKQVDHPWSLRHRALGELHSEQVHEFINRAGNGLSRMPVVSPYDLKMWPSFDGKLEQRQVDSDLFAERIIPLRMQPVKRRHKEHRYELDANGMPTIWQAELFNDSVSQSFASADSTGFVRSIDEVAGFEPHRVQLFESWPGNLRLIDMQSLEQLADDVSQSTVWIANRLELVSLMLNEKPRVYLSENLPNMAELSGSDVETRALNDFETTALQKLREGEELVTRATANRIVMMGAVRSTEHCTQCHSTGKGELLGAFSYEFLRKPKREVRINL